MGATWLIWRWRLQCGSYASCVPRINEETGSTEEIVASISTKLVLVLPTRMVLVRGRKRAPTSCYQLLLPLYNIAYHSNLRVRLRDNLKKVPHWRNHAKCAKSSPQPPHLTDNLNLVSFGSPCQSHLASSPTPYY